MLECLETASDLWHNIRRTRRATEEVRDRIALSRISITDSLQVLSRSLHEVPRHPWHGGSADGDDRSWKPPAVSS
jgi:hypothetical protein